MAVADKPRRDRAYRFKGQGYLVSSLSVVLLAFASWRSLAADPVLAALLVLGAITSLAGMLLRWLSFRAEKRTNDPAIEESGLVEAELGSALIIEDEMVIAWCLKDILERGGFSPVVVSSTDTSAAAVLDNDSLNLVVCDLDLGDLTAGGLEILVQHDPHEQIPTLIYSALDAPSVQRKLNRLRPSAAFISKPADDAELFKAAVATARGRKK